MSFQREVSSNHRAAAQSATLSLRSGRSAEPNVQTGDEVEHIAFARFVTVDKAAALTGLTAKAIRRKIEEGVWTEHHQWVRGPDGRIYIDVHGFTKWVQAWRQ